MHDSNKKIFIVSLHRTMTRSTDALISMLGYSTVHFPKFFGGRNLMEDARGLEERPEALVELLAPLIETVDSVSDVPIPVLYRQLAQRWPKSRFILVERDTNGWVRSVRQHLRRRELSPYNLAQYLPYLGRVSDISKISDAALGGMYLRHSQEVQRYFNDELKEPSRLCTVSIKDPEVGEKICRFLGHEPMSMPRISGRLGEQDLAVTREWAAACPDKVDALYYYAKNLHHAGDPQAAEQELTRALSLESDHPKVLSLLSDVLEKQGRWREAAELGARAWRVGLRRPRLRRRVLRAYVRRGRPFGALRVALSMARSMRQRRHEDKCQ